MDQERLNKYNILFERMIDAMTDPNNFDREEFVGILCEICELFNLAKGVTEFYNSLSAEREGKGEVLIDYDNGKGDRVAIFRRIVTPSKTVIKSTIYMSADSEPLTDEEYRKVDLILRAMLSFISRNRLQTIVEKLSFYDEVGYPNLNYFMRHLDYLNEIGKIHGNTTVQLNLRHFSLVNQEFGLQAGDVALRNTFELIKAIIGDKGIVCRVGGDNFVAIFSSEILKFILRIADGFPIVYDNEHEKRVMVSACVGVFVIPDDYIFTRPGEIFGRAHAAMQEAKLEYNGTVVYYSDNAIAEKEKVMRVRQQFSDALKNGEFQAFYQPKVDITTGKIIGTEALCRWIKDGRIIPPAEFIPILEQNTDICRLDFHMLEIVCRDMRAWLDKGNSAVRASVNLSRKHLLDVDLLDHLLGIIDNYRIPHEFIEFELTETTTDVGFREIKRIVSGLREAGIHTTVDDFGIGYSSLNLIREIPWDVVKLDRCFMPLDNNNDTTELMFRHIISMAQDMGLECVAEGVETKEHIELMKKNNCHIAQGFFFDKPIPKHEFEKKLENFRYEIQ
ncbi:MAG: EAL domain-containing protein [Ruminiclostridium sp.]|nr:EAL domain-containing protein [Ruminiclostridium sp.]